MTTTTIKLDDATELAKQVRAAPLDRGLIRLSVREMVREINLGDARDASGFLGQVEGDARGFYGFNPIPAGGAPVTNELVNKLREDLGI